MGYQFHVAEICKILSESGMSYFAELKIVAAQCSLIYRKKAGNVSLVPTYALVLSYTKIT